MLANRFAGEISSEMFIPYGSTASVIFKKVLSLELDFLAQNFPSWKAKKQALTIESSRSLQSTII